MGEKEEVEANGSMCDQLLINSWHVGPCYKYTVGVFFETWENGKYANNKKNLWLLFKDMARVVWITDSIALFVEFLFW